MDIKKITKYLATGGLAVLVEYVSFILFVSVFSLAIANILSFTFGFVTSFSLNRSWVFRATEGVRVQLFKYFLLAVFNSVISTSVLWLLVERGDVSAPLAKVIVMGLVAAWNYVIFAKYVFMNNKI